MLFLCECYVVSEIILRKVVLIYEYKREEVRVIEIEFVIYEMENEDDELLILFIRLSR